MFARYRAAVPALWPRLRAWRDGLDPGRDDRNAPRSRWQLARYSDNNELGTLIAIGAALLLFWARAHWGGR